MRNRKISKKQMEQVHPHIPDMYEKLKQGRVTRREFLRTATLLGMSAGVATVAAACGAESGEGIEDVAATLEAVATDVNVDVEGVVEEVEETVDEVMDDGMGDIVRGGTLRLGESVKASDHPARYAWAFDADQTRMVYEYLSETDKNNITHPYLLESWSPNDDLTVWDLNLRQGILFSNGDELKSEHVVWNLEQWLNPDTGSSILGLWEGFLTTSGIEVVDDYTIRFNLDGSLLAVPENLFHYPAQIIHPSFDGDITSGNTPGTGPHIIEEYLTGERVRTVARWSVGDETYWQKGADGKPLTYYEAIEWVDLGEDDTAYVAALQGGQIDNFQPGVDAFLALRNDDNVAVASIGTSQCRVWRMRQDLEPWTDQRLVNAVKKVQDREKILDTSYFGEGILGYDTHIAPVHPAWSPMELPPYDPDGARALLDEAGVDSLDFSVSIGTGWTDVVAFAENVQEDAKVAGINITLDTMPTSAFWELWTETAVGITPWTHRPLAVMLLPLAYITDAEGTPVPWNESRFVDQEFMDILAVAQGTLDIEARRALYADLQRIQQERGAVLISYFMNVWEATNQNVHGLEAHPTSYRLFREVWVDA